MDHNLAKALHAARAVEYPLIIERETERWVERNVRFNNCAPAVAEERDADGIAIPTAAVNGLQISRAWPSSQIENSISPAIGAGRSRINTEDVRRVIIPLRHLILIFRRPGREAGRKIVNHNRQVRSLARSYIGRRRLLAGGRRAW